MIKDSIKIGNLELSTRIILPPMATEKSDDGKVTDALCQYYKERAQNPFVGMIISEHMYISKRGQASRGQLSIADDSVIEGLKKLNQIIHKTDPQIKTFAQINHAGLKTKSELTGFEASGPSQADSHKCKGNAFSLSEISDVVDLFVKAAIRVKEAGFDGVEIHSAHGYLLNQFYSPLINKREDEYGPQSIESRLKIHKEIIEKIREALGPDYPIVVRLGGSDYEEGGSTESDAVKAAKLLESYGVDMIDVTGGMNGYLTHNTHTYGYFTEMSQKIAEAVAIPVLSTGGVTTLDQAEEILKSGKADLVGIGRALYQDPNWGLNKEED